MPIKKMPRTTIVYKKAETIRTHEPVIIALEVRAGTRYHERADFDDGNISLRKCRCASARVISITGTFVPWNGKCKKPRAARSKWDTSFVYRVGEIVKPKDRFNASDSTCESGIHFFFDRNDALLY